MLEILADTEEVRGQRVIHQELLDLRLGGSTGFGCVIDQAGTIADFSVEDLTGG